MKRVIFGIFAHPDDEAFGVAGTLISEQRQGTEINLITLTAGEEGVNPDNYDNLATERLKEWRKGGEIIGTREMFHLGFRDGHLTNLSMIEASAKLEEIVQKRLAELPDDCIVEFMSMDTNGISGHIDHIVAARAAIYTFYAIKKTDSRLSRMRLRCLPDTELPESSISWIYQEKGRTEAEIDEVVKADKYYDEVVECMKAHHSQRADCETHLQRRGRSITTNYFMVLD